MDLSQLPSSLSRLRKVDKKAMALERKEYWNNFFNKYAEISEKDEDELSIDEIDDPWRVSDSSSMIGLEDKPVTYSSKIFQDWVRDHEDEIDELTTIAGPVGEDEEELGEDIDEDDESEDHEDMEDCSDECEQVPINQENDILEMTDSGDECNVDCYENDDNSDCCDIDSDLGLSRIFPRSLQLMKEITPVKQDPNHGEKQMFSPKLASKLSTPVKRYLSPSKKSLFSPKLASRKGTPVKGNISITENAQFSPKLASSRNQSLLQSRLDESTLSNLTCQSCGNDTDYSIDMGIKDEVFECDDCALSVHPDCEEDCQLCKQVASKINKRWSLKRNYLQNGAANITT